MTPPIAEAHRLDHGAIGNGRVLALVAPTTHMDWLCLPRFDSPSVFARLLDAQIGGTWALVPVGDAPHFSMDYVPNTNVLRTRVTASDGAFDVFDFAPRLPAGLDVDAPLEVHRLLVPVQGTPRLRVVLEPRPDYARHTPTARQIAGGIEYNGSTSRLFLRTSLPAPYVLNGQPIRLDREAFLALGYGAMPEAESPMSCRRLLELTIAGWRAWAMSGALPQFAPKAVLRSALCLKLHAHIDTGAIIAATTTSVPEAVGTERTWDYRFCWLRDAAFVVEGLRRTGHLAEGEAFIRFLQNVAESGPLQPVYGVAGERELNEIHLDHLAGFANSRPVRVGNAAYQQKQNDLMGELVLCLETLVRDERLVLDDPKSVLPLLERLVNDALTVYPTTDTGIWEFRSLLRHYTFSKVMCWVAVSRGARLAEFLGRRELAHGWRTWADHEHKILLSAAYSEKHGYFTQALHGQFPDASNLLLPTVGFVDARDPRFVSTVRAYEQLLTRRGLMLRYANPDDFGDTHSAFTICSFWWAEALAMMGELDAAVAVFERLMAHANPVGLFSEDIDPSTGRLIGNFPQAYTHVGLIHAAVTIGELMEARDGRFRAWT